MAEHLGLGVPEAGDPEILFSKRKKGRRHHLHPVLKKYSKGNRILQPTKETKPISLTKTPRHFINNEYGIM